VDAARRQLADADAAYADVDAAYVDVDAGRNDLVERCWCGGGRTQPWTLGMDIIVIVIIIANSNAFGPRFLVRHGWFCACADFGFRVWRGL